MMLRLLTLLAVTTSPDTRPQGVRVLAGSGEATASAAKEKRAPVDSDLRRTRATGDWTILVPSSFELVDHGDSWQAHKGDRIVHVSSLEVKETGGAKTPATVICGVAGKKFAKSSGERFSISERKLRGEAEIVRNADHWQLKGVMCADGTLATCLIDYPDERYKAWAVSTWKSLAHQ